MNYRVRGEGPPVILLHGLPTNGRLWDLVVARLSERFRCFAVDLPGFGETPLLHDGPLDLEDYVEELDILRERLGLDGWHVVGHDAGSTIGTHYAARFEARVHRLVLCSAPLFPEHRVPHLLRLMRVPLLGEAVALAWVSLLWRVAVTAGLSAAGPEIDDAVDSFGRPFRGFRGARRLTHLIRWGDPGVVLARTASLLPGFTVPTLVVHGERDRAIPRHFAERAAEAIPEAELLILPNGHFLPLECPDALTAALVDFLGRDS